MITRDDTLSIKVVNKRVEMSTARAWIGAKNADYPISHVFIGGGYGIYRIGGLTTKGQTDPVSSGIGGLTLDDLKHLRDALDAVVYDEEH